MTAEPQLPSMRSESAASAVTISSDRTIPAQYDLLLAKISLAGHELESNGLGGRTAHRR